MTPEMYFQIPGGTEPKQLQTDPEGMKNSTYTVYTLYELESIDHRKNHDCFTILPDYTLSLIDIVFNLYYCVAPLSVLKSVLKVNNILNKR